MRHIEEILFTEKYAPKTISDLILPDRLRTRFIDGLSSFPRILLHSSSPGNGKTSLAKILVDEFKHPNLYINASQDAGVDLLRGEAKDFCSNQSMHTIKNQKMKVVIFDEIDGASIQFFKSLRGFVQEFKHVGFIATCNYINKVPEAIQSRFNKIDFTFTEEDQEVLRYKYAERLLKIAKAEGLSLSLDALETIIPKYYPDLRSMINLLQSFKSEKKLKITGIDIKNSYSLFDNLFELTFTGSTEAIYKIVMEDYSSRIETSFSAFFNDFFTFIKKNKPDYSNYIPQIIIKIAQYQSLKNSIIDPPLALMAMIYDIQLLLNQKQ